MDTKDDDGLGLKKVIVISKDVHVLYGPHNVQGEVWSVLLVLLPSRFLCSDEHPTRCCFASCASHTLPFDIVPSHRVTVLPPPSPHILRPPGNVNACNGN